MSHDCEYPMDNEDGICPLSFDGTHSKSWWEGERCSRCYARPLNEEEMKEAGITE